jgi:predicted TIM-barrel fold metal-dependent hydrolase
MHNLTLDRRTFLAGLFASPLLADGKELLLDIHVHLFGVGDGGTGCRMVDKIRKGQQFQRLVEWLRIRERAKTLDEGYELALVEHLKGSGLDWAAIVAQDAIYGGDGKANWDRTSFYIPNDYVFQVVAKHPKSMLACPSINPDRGDAIEELERCQKKDARIFKIHPPTQGVDVSDRKHDKFFRRCADLGMVVLVHTGHEHSAPVIHPDLANPKRLQRALELGCTVVAAHAGSGRTTDKPDQLPEFLDLLKRYKNLWGDTSVLGTALRVRDFYRLLDHASARDRLLHGSDFPFPIAPRMFSDRITKKKAEEIEKEASWLKRDLALKEALGLGHTSAKQSYKIVKGGKA